MAGILEFLNGSFWFILIMALIIQLLIADKFNAIAIMKGHDGYFGWCFLLGIVGWCMVIALPDLYARPQADEHPEQEASAENTNREVSPKYRGYLYLIFIMPYSTINFSFDNSTYSLSILTFFIIKPQ